MSLENSKYKIFKLNLKKKSITILKFNHNTLEKEYYLK